MTYVQPTQVTDRNHTVEDENLWSGTGGEGLEENVEIEVVKYWHSHIKHQLGTTKTLKTFLPLQMPAC